MKILCLIPARLNSSRFPGKPLALINGKPMIHHVYEKCSRCDDLDDIYVATCDTEIVDSISSIGGNSVLTSSKHERASDRCAEALLKIEEEKKIKYDLVVMVQGDEPLVSSTMIAQSIAPFFNNSDLNVVNLRSSIRTYSDFCNPNIIKVAIDNQGYALYFSRSGIPYLNKKEF